MASDGQAGGAGGGGGGSGAPVEGDRVSGGGCSGPASFAEAVPALSTERPAKQVPPHCP